MKLNGKLCKIAVTAAAAAAIGMFSTVAHATTWYVNAAIGSDSNTGLTDTAGSNGPWATISHAASVVTAAGDTVEVEPGTYTTSVTYGGNVSVTNGGSSTGGYITYQSVTRGQAIVVCHGGASASTTGFWVSASWVHIDGFTITEPQPLPVADGGSGIILGPAYGTNNLGPHHDWISNNTIYDTGGTGIQTLYGDYWTIEYNTIHNCASTSPYSESGISQYMDANAPGDTDTGIHNIEAYNTSYDNVIIPADQGGGSAYDADGEGIIIDSADDTTAQSEYAPAHSPYLSQTLIEDNLCYNNGGRGIMAGPHSNNVIAINNTCYEDDTDNNDTTTARGELCQQLSYDCTWANNIGVADSSTNGGADPYSAYNTGIYWGDGGTSAPDSTYVDNLTYDVNNTTSQSVNGDPQFVSYLTIPQSPPVVNLLGIDPVFVTPGSDFQLQPSSPAINFGSSAYTQPSTDLVGNSRVVGAAVDLGAYEYQGTTSAIPTLASISPTSATEGASQITLTATGTNYLDTSQINWNNIGLTTTYVSPTELTATVPAADLAFAGSESVTVFTPTGGTSSPPIWFPIPNPDPAQYNFESGVQGWTSGGSPIASVAAGSTEAYAGLHSLAINVSGETTSETPTVSVNGPGVSDGQTVTFHVWIPSGMPLNWLQAGTVDGTGYTWNTDLVTSLTAGAWNTLTVTIPSNAGTVDSLVVQWTTKASFTGAVYVDSIGWPSAAPTITSFSPTAGTVGTSVTIAGTNFTGATSVTFNGTSAIFTVNSATSITAIAPAGGTTGPLAVTTPEETATSSTDFTYGSGAPTIASFTPTSGPAGTSVAISGTNFIGATLVKFNGTAAIFTVNASTSITATSPSGATTGTISVTTPGGTATSSGVFEVTTSPGGPSGNAPAAPTGLSAVAGNDRVTLTWSASVHATGYDVYRSTTSGKGYAKIGASATLTYTDSSVKNGKTYYYVVTAVDSAGASGYSNQASATPIAPAPVRIPAAPTGLSAVAGNDRVTLTWSASTRATGYNMYRSTTRGSGYAKIGPSATATYTDSSVTDGKTYYYVVTAVDSAGASGYSNVASATPTAPAAPVIASFPAGINFISLPYDYSSDSLASVLGYGDPILAVWSPTASSYILSPNSPADRIRLGVGYWVRFPKAVSVTLRGTPASTTGVAIDLSPGWNQIGDPYPSSVALSGVGVANGFNDDSYADAVSAGLIGPVLYRYDTGTGAYETVAASGSLEPGSGYFIDAFASVTLQVNPP